MTVLITTDHCGPDDEADRILTAAGLATRYARDVRVAAR